MLPDSDQMRLPDKIESLETLSLAEKLQALVSTLKILTVHWQLGILFFFRFSADVRPNLAPKPLQNDGARLAVPVAPQINPADQF